MLRSAANLSLRHSSRVTLVALKQPGFGGPHPTSFSSLRPKEQFGRILSVNPSLGWSRTLSSQSGGRGGKAEETSDPKDGETTDETKELVLTPGQKVAVASRLTMWAGMFGVACICAYYIGKELIPTKMSPNTVFNGASATIRSNSTVVRVYGDKLKFYGKDHDIVRVDETLLNIRNIQDQTMDRNGPVSVLIWRDNSRMPFVLLKFRVICPQENMYTF